jgi:hypothetical protein
MRTHDMTLIEKLNDYLMNVVEMELIERGMVPSIAEAIIRMVEQHEKVELLGRPNSEIHKSTTGQYLERIPTTGRGD